MMREIGAQVRTYHGSKGVTGVIISKAPPSDIDGSERIVVRWTFPDGRQTESRWSPDVLVPVDAPREDDPPFVLLGRDPKTGKYSYLTDHGIVQTEADPDVINIFFDKKLFDAILGPGKSQS